MNWPIIFLELIIEFELFISPIILGSSSVRRTVFTFLYYSQNSNRFDYVCDCKKREKKVNLITKKMGSGHSKHGKQTEMKTKQNRILHVLKESFSTWFFFLAFSRLKSVEIFS